jgi:MerR family transcriptional regulator, copper efflux regulator
MNIGDAASASGVSTKMIRYYESIGLIPAVERTDSGYRVYSETDVDALRFIRHARDLGFSVEQIERLLALWRDGHRASAEVKKLALEHAEALEAKAAELRAMSRTLRVLIDHCHGDDRAECPIIRELAKGELEGYKAPPPKFGVQRMHGTKPCTC